MRQSPWVLAIALGVAALLLALSTRYGYHRDELYFIEAGERLAWGYVDQPPLTPLMARLSGVFGHSLPALRFLPALSMGALVLLAGLFARRFGGGPFAQALAALSTASAGIFLAVGHLLSTTTFDVLIWATLVYIVLLIVQTDRTRLWLLAGLTAGIGLLNKWTVLFLAAALLIALLFTRRSRVFRGPWVWAGAGVALALWVPNLVWQAQHDWPFFEMARSLRTEGIEDANSFLFIPMQVLLIGPVAAPIWIAGLVSTLRSRKEKVCRWVGWSYVILLITFIGLSSRPYFLAPLYVPLLGAGAVSVERWLSRPRRVLTPSRILGVVAAGGLVGLLLSVPVLSPSTLANLPISDVNPELGETYGWESLTEEVAAVFRTLSPVERSQAVIFTASYGEAGAIDLYGTKYGLPKAASGHNNYWLWGPPEGEPVVIVGYFDKSFLETHFEGLRQVGVISNDAGLRNEEFGAPIWLAERVRGSWTEAWPGLRHYN